MSSSAPGSARAPAASDVVTGVALACFATSIGGVTVVLTRLIIDETGPLSLTFLRYGIAALVLAGFLAVGPKPPRIAPRDFAIIAVIAIFMFTGFPYFMARALEDTTAARGALLFATAPVMTILTGAVFRVERLTAIKLAAVFLAISGTVLALSESAGDIAPNALRGDFFMFLGLASSTAFNVFSGRYLARYGTLYITTLMIFIGVLVLFVLALIFEAPFSGSLDFDLRGWTVILVLAIPGAALMIYSWSRALRLIPPTQATITVGLNPLTAILLSAWVLSEPVSPRAIGGFVLVVAAIVLANRRPRKGGGKRAPR